MTANKIIRKSIAIFLSFVTIVFFTSCDSGDIYPDDEDTDGTGFGVTASFSLKNTETFPERYLLVFGAFNDKDSEPVAYISIQKPSDKPVNISLSNLPNSITSLKLCLTTLGKQPIYTFYSYDVNTDDTIEIPETEVDLLQYGRIQSQVFDLGTCTSCHSSSGGAAGLRLSEGRSYADLVEQPATKSTEGKLRVKSGHVSESFLIDVLTNPEALSPQAQPHTSMLAKDEDLSLLKEWIKTGAKK